MISVLAPVRSDRTAENENGVWPFQANALTMVDHSSCTVRQCFDSSLVLSRHWPKNCGQSIDLTALVWHGAMPPPNLDHLLGLDLKSKHFNIFNKTHYVATFYKYMLAKSQNITVIRQLHSISHWLTQCLL
eukprot:sb/3475045/